MHYTYLYVFECNLLYTTCMQFVLDYLYVVFVCTHIYHIAEQHDINISCEIKVWFDTIGLILTVSKANVLLK